MVYQQYNVDKINEDIFSRRLRGSNKSFYCTFFYFFNLGQTLRELFFRHSRMHANSMQQPPWYSCMYVLAIVRTYVSPSDLYFVILY